MGYALMTERQTPAADRNNQAAKATS